MTHKLNPLPYAYDSLEPFIDEQTMKIHHDKHHQTYTDKLNDALKDYPELQNKKAEELLKEIKSVPEKIRQAVINHGGGYVNHNFFWEILKKGVTPKGEIIDEINKNFESLEKFKEIFNQAAMMVFGSGWVWLVVDEKGVLGLAQTRNQDSPLSFGQTPILGLDLWEHAYYLKYQNKRADYVSAFWNVVNWDKVNEFYKESKK